MAESVLPPPGYPAAIPRPTHLVDLHQVMIRCTRCDLFLSRCRVVPGTGAEDAAVLFVGEAPGAQEDRQGTPFCGRSGELLDAMLDTPAWTRDRVFIANVVRCRPPGN